MITGFSYFGVYSVEQARRDFQRMRKHHANAVLITLSENDVEFNLDNVRQLVSCAHDEGLLVYTNPWGVGKVFGGEPYSALALRNPAFLQIDDHGDPAPAICPNSRVFHEYLAHWIESARFTGADGVMWDEPHFFLFHWYPEFRERNSRLTCFCPVCQARFAEQYGRPMPMAETDEVLEFRHRSLLNLLDWASGLMHEAGMQNSVCVLPPELDWKGGIRDVEDVFRLPHMNAIGTDPYWWEKTDAEPIAREYRRNSEMLVKWAHQHGKEAEIWVQNFKIPRGHEELVGEATRAAFEAGVRRIWAWSYLGSAYMSYIRSEDPEAVFRAQGEAFRRCQGEAGGRVQGR